MNSLIFILGLLSLTTARGAEPCAPRSCSSFTNKSICLAGVGAPEDLKEVSTQDKLCGKGGVLKVATKADLAKAIKKLSDDCVKIDRLYISSSGRPGSPTLDPQNPLMVNSVAEQLGGFRCLTQKGSLVQFLGSLIGNGCRGEDFVRTVARTLLPEGGRVSARMGYRNAVTDDYLSTANNRNLTFDYAPEGQPKESWVNNSTLAGGQPESYQLNSQRCAEELQKARQVYDSVAEAAKTSSCKVADQSALKDRAKQMESDFRSRKIPDQRFESGYNAYEYLSVVGNLDFAAYETAAQCPKIAPGSLSGGSSGTK